MAHALFFGGSGRRAVAHKRRAINPTSSKGEKAWGRGPLRPKEFPRHRDTRCQIYASTTRATKVLHSTWRGPVQNQSFAKMIWTAAKVISQSICCTPHLTDKCGTWPFFGGSGRRAVAHTCPAFPKNTYGPVRILLIRGGSGAERLTQPPRTEYKPGRKALLRPKEFPRHRDTLGQIRASTTRPAKAPGEVQSKINLSPKWFGPPLK